MKPSCPYCFADKKKISKNGRFKRKSDSKIIQKFFCTKCLKNFSHATFSDAYFQKKRTHNHLVKALLCSSVSQRRIAKILNLNLKTVARKLLFLSMRAERNHAKFLEDQTFGNIQFDDLETFEHTKLKPLTVSMAIEEGTRKIIGFKVSPIGAKGLLTHKSRKLYGKRKNESFKSREKLFKELKRNIIPVATFKTDEHKHYPRLIQKHFPLAKHKRYKSQRGSIVGQGELKRVAFDPLFSVNHTFAMLRANINRLVRRTWCTTKKIECLIAHLWIYLDFHNSVLTNSS